MRAVAISSGVKEVTEPGFSRIFNDFGILLAATGQVFRGFNGRESLSN